MRLLPKNPTVLAAGMAAAALACATSAVAQSTVEELTVTGHGKPTDDTMSYVVGFSDLNLKDESGRKELTRRVNLVASYVCRKLHDREVQSNPACEQQAVKEAMAKVRAVEHEAQVHGATLVAGRPWAPPGD